MVLIAESHYKIWYYYILILQYFLYALCIEEFIDFLHYLGFYYIPNIVLSTGDTLNQRDKHSMLKNLIF